MNRNYFDHSRNHREDKRWGEVAAQRHTGRAYAAREHNDRMREKFEKQFPEQRSPWGQSEEMDALILKAQTASPADDRIFHGVTVERCMVASRIRMYVEEHVTQETVELAANIISPRDGAPWRWDGRSLVTEMDSGWLVTLFA